MKKIVMIMLGVMAGICLASSAVYAQQQDFTVSVFMPTADTASFTVNKVVENADGSATWTEVDTTDLDLGDLSLVTGTDADGEPFQVFLPNHYYAIDVGSNGAGNPDVLIELLSDTPPAGATDGLGKHGAITVAEVIFGEPEPNNILSGSFLDMDGYSYEAPTGSWTRVSIGAATGEDLDGTFDDASNAVPFTASNPTGTYTATVRLSATFDAD
jgi:hypothetical protein